MRQVRGTEGKIMGAVDRLLPGSAAMIRLLPAIFTRRFLQGGLLDAICGCLPAGGPLAAMDAPPFSDSPDSAEAA